MTAVAVGNGCGSETGEGRSPTTNEGTMPSATCDTEIDDAIDFFDQNPDGPASLDESKRATLVHLINDVEARCSEAEVAKFGEEHLEPWSGAPSHGDGTITTGGP